VRFAQNRQHGIIPAVKDEFAYAFGARIAAHPSSGVREQSEISSLGRQVLIAGGVVCGGLCAASGFLDPPIRAFRSRLRR
jgi:hypothetical protein